MPAPSHYAFGLDISKYDIRYRASQRPVDFVIQRASYGLRVDERFERLHNDIQPVPIRGAYHYYNTGVNWQDQAEKFLRVVDGRGYHFLAFDYETYYNNLSAKSAAEARRIMTFWRAETGLQVLLYCNPNVYETHLRPHGDWMADWPLWISQWPSKWWYQNRATGPRLPKGVSQWAFWQYGGDYQHPSGLWSVPGYNEGPAWGVQARHVDLNVFNGTPEELRAWAGLTRQTDPEKSIPADPPKSPSPRAQRLDELARMEGYIETRKRELL